MRVWRFLLNVEIRLATIEQLRICALKAFAICYSCARFKRSGFGEVAMLPIARYRIMLRLRTEVLYFGGKNTAERVQNKLAKRKKNKGRKRAESAA